MSVKYKSINSQDFYTLFNVIRLYFRNNYDIVKYGLSSNRIKNKYDTDKLKDFYDKHASKISTRQDAVFLILGNFINDVNTFITTFDRNLCYNNQFNRYHNNKILLIEDFKYYCENNKIGDKISTGELADDVILKKENIILFSYINKIVPVIDVSIDNLNKPEIALELFFAQDNKSDNIYDNNIVNKIGTFIKIGENRNELKTIILNIISNTTDTDTDT